MGSGAWPLAMATRPARPPHGCGPWVCAPVCEREASFLPCARGASAARGCCRCARTVFPRARPGLDGQVCWRGGKRIRAISAGKLTRVAPLRPPAYRRGGLPRLSTRPGFEEGFPLRCVQRLSRPHLATRRCGWRHNRSTRGASLPVLSYWGERLASLEHPRQIGTELSHDVLNPAHVPL